MASDDASLFRLLARAASFGDVLAHSGQHDADVVSVLGRDLASLALQPRPEPFFASLDRLVRLRAAAWLHRPFAKHTLAGDSATPSEHDPDDAPDDSDPDPPPVEPPASPPALPAPLPAPPATPPAPELASPLTPAEQLALIIAEFGPLAADGEEERLLVESDASFFQDVVILGVVHLTTHRITFHASLLDARPDLAAPRHVLHAGAAAVRTTGLRRHRKRVWLELTDDMLTSFRGSDEHARVRPLRTVLLSALRRIYPIDPQRPRALRVEYVAAPPAHARTPHLRLRRAATQPAPPPPDTMHSDEIEFDTEEAALEWRRELHAALFRFSRYRRRVLHGSEDGEDDGVRINIPLARVAAHAVEAWANFGTILRVGVEAGACAGPGADAGVGAEAGHRRRASGDTDSGADSSADFDHGACLDPSPSVTPHLDRSATTVSQASSGSSAADPVLGPALSDGWTPPRRDTATSLHFALLRPDPAWDRLATLILAARVRAAPPAHVTVDFGVGTFVEHGLPAVHDASSSREREVRRVFGLSDDLDIWLVRCSLVHTPLSTSGLLVVSPRFVCFWSRLVAAADVKLRFAAPDVRAAASPGARAGLVLRVRGQRDVTLEFGARPARDEALRRLAALAAPPAPAHAAPPAPAPRTPPRATALLAPLARTLPHLRARTFPPTVLPHLAAPINVPRALPFGAAPAHFVCLTVGSRGDVQPYIALGRALRAAGHRVTIVTHLEYKEWIERWGVGHRTAGGDPGRLMKLSVEHKMFSPQFFRESIANFRSWIDELLVEAWEQCHDADVLIESPPAMAGVHIAEALKIPYFRAFTMPWSKTAQYPHALISPPVEGSAGFNLASYVLFDNVFWLGTSGQINRWRKKHLGLPPTDMGHLAQAKIPFLYNFSPAVVPKPLDWGDHISITGYWFLDDPDPDWTAPAALLEFMRRARADGKPLVYIGFGSITVAQPRAMTRSIVKAVRKSDVRAILSKGWSDRMTTEEGPDVELPPEIYGVDKVPHDWLFPQIDAAMHHGGAGTTGASLRAGIPTLIKPWFGDQFFWASRVQKLGAGMRVASLRSADVADALRRATSDRVMREKAAQVGEQIAQEDGVSTAIKALYTYMHRARMHRTASADK